MKKLLLLLFLIGWIGYSQSIERQVIGSSGTVLTDGSVASTNFTVGELVVTNITDGSIATLTQGFHQGEIRLEINLSPVVFLQGAALNPNTGEENLMRDDLRVASYIPTTSPYADAATCDASAFTVTGPDAIVDWVWVELRDDTDSSIIVHGQSALLQRDGDIVGVDGASILSLTASPNTYHVAIKHRNHLGIMTSNAISLSDVVTVLNFTDIDNQITYGSNAQTIVGMPSGLVGMWAGDVNGDGIAQYTGGTADSPEILTYALNDPGNFLNFPTFTVNGYSNYDVDMNGGAQYTGSSADSPILLQNALAHPGNFLGFATYSITAQLP